MISIVIWTFITLNALLLIMPHIPTAQRFIGSKVSEMLSEELGTKVSVGSVTFGFFNRLIVDDLTMLDRDSQEMLRAARLSVKIDILPLMEGKISISSAQLFGTHARLYRKDEHTAPNFQFVIDKLSSNDTTSSPLDLRINSLIIRRSSVTYDQLNQPQTDGIFNTSHLKVSNISAHLNLRTLTDDSLSINVKRLGFNEQSGLSINRFTCKLNASKQHAQLSELMLEMPSSRLQISNLNADYLIDEKGLQPGSLSFDGSISETSITPSDLMCFQQTLKNFQRSVHLETSFSGTDQKLMVDQLTAYTHERDIEVIISGWIDDWKQQRYCHLQVDRLQLSESSFDFLSKQVPQMPSEIKRLGNLLATGTFDHDYQHHISAIGHLQSGAGDLDLQFKMDNQKQFESEVQTGQLNLRQLLADHQLGDLAAKLSLHGQWDSQHPDIYAEGHVSHFGYNDYTYENININGKYTAQSIAGILHIDDPNVALNLEGIFSTNPDDTSGKTKKVSLDGTISHIMPSALHLSDQWGEAAISGDINAEFTASNLNDAVGSIRISNAGITGDKHHQAYKLDNLIVTTGYDNQIHYVTLKSDFADATLRGEFDYASLPQGITSLVASKLPTLPGLPTFSKETNNNFNLRLMVTKTDWLKRFFDVDLLLSQPLILNASINDHTKELFLDADMPSFALNGAWYSDANIHATTPADTLRCDIRIKKLLDSVKALDADLKLKAANNKIKTSLSWDNHLNDRRICGNLNSIVQLYHNLDNQPEAHVRVQPSQLIFNDGKWEVEPSDIIYKKDHLLVDNFLVRRGNQHILIDGVASKNPYEHLTAELNEIEVAYILDLVNFTTVAFSGKATGKATAAALFDKFEANANLRVDDFKFEQGRMGVLHANVGWNKQEEQIDIQAVADDGPGVTTIINGFVSPTHNTIDLAIEADSTYIDFMHSFTNSFLSHITGHTDGEVRLAGTLDNINLTGKLMVEGEATVSALNTTYRLERDTIVFVPDEITISRLSLLDRDGHKAYLSGGIHHQHLTNLTFDLNAEAENLLVYDFPDFGESNFYGTVYANGDVSIIGRPGEVSINCNATPQRNSFFVYNAAETDDISQLEFIEWESTKQNGTNSSSSTPQGNPSAEGTVSRVSDTDIYINILINATPDATLRLLMDESTQDYITLNGDGTIRATYHNKGAFNMFGTYTVDHGTYDVTIQNIISKNFIFNNGGTIIFAGDPYQAELHLQAVHTVSGVSLSDLNIGNSFSSNTIRVNCLMNISGQAAAPQIDFDLEMPTVNADEQQMVRSIINGQQEMNQQVIYLLGIGRFYTQGTNNAETTQNDATSLAMQSLLSGTLSAQINSLLNQFVKNDNWNLGANITTGNEGWHNAEYEGIVNGRMLNNRLLLNGQFGYRDNATQATPSFIGDFDIQYLLNPNGNLSLKVYNQTNDRYFTKSSLNTQGLGIIMKKDFTHLRDLFTFKKRKKKDQKKQEQHK